MSSNSISAVPIVNNKLLKPLTIDPDRTTESIEARKIENRLLIEFNAILIQIQKKIDFNLSDYKMQFEKVKATLSQTVYDIIRSYYQQAYIIGSNYVNKALGSTSYLTDSDITHIKTQTENFASRFFGRIEKMLETSASKAIQSIFDTGSLNAPLVLENQVSYFAKNIENTKSYLFSSLAILVVTDAINSATINKSKAIHESILRQNPNLQNVDSNLLSGAVTLEETSFQLMDVELVRLMLLLNTLKLKWYTSADDRVCSICRNLEGKSWTLSLSLAVNDIPKIPDSTHFNCRCRLFLEADI